MKNDKELMEILRDKFLKDINEFFKKNEGTSIFIPLSSLLGTVGVLLSMADRSGKFSSEIENYIETSFFKPTILMEKILKENRSIN